MKTRLFLRLLSNYNYIPDEHKPLSREILVRTARFRKAYIAAGFCVYTGKKEPGKMNTDSVPSDRESGTFPSEYLEILSDHLSNTLYEWMNEEGAPKALIEAVGTITVLRMYGSWQRQGPLEGELAEDVLYKVAQAVRLIKAFGGEFYDGGSVMKFDPVVRLVGEAMA